MCEINKKQPQTSAPLPQLLFLYSKIFIFQVFFLFFAVLSCDKKIRSDNYIVIHDISQIYNIFLILNLTFGYIVVNNILVYLFNFFTCSRFAKIREQVFVTDLNRK